MRYTTRLLAIALLALGTPTTLAAQQSLDREIFARCQDTFAPGTNDRFLCHDAVASLQLLQPELGLLLADGNPVLGTASPIGTKFRFIPRFHVSARLSWVWAEIPDLLVYPTDIAQPLATRSFSVPKAQLDLSVGLFDGLRLGTTLSGLASVELLGSLGAIMLPNDDGFENDLTGWGLGARMGILRESFTAPGISISGMYKWQGRVRYGDGDEGDAGELGIDISVFSFRAGLSKSFVALNFALTVGYDSYRSDVDFALNPPPAGDRVTVVPDSDPLDLQAERWSAFVDVSYIVLYFNIVAEAGWQEEQKLPSSRGAELETGNFFGSIGIRVTL